MCKTLFDAPQRVKATFCRQVAVCSHGRPRGLQVASYLYLSRAGRGAKAAAHWRGNFGGVACFDFMLRAVVEASASTASIARLFLCMVLGLCSVAMLWLSVIAFCTGTAFTRVLAEQHVSCAGRLKAVWYLVP